MEVNADASNFATDLKKGQAALISVDAYITGPLSEITFTAAQPLGYYVSNFLIMLKNVFELL